MVLRLRRRSDGIGAIQGSLRHGPGADQAPDHPSPAAGDCRPQEHGGVPADRMETQGNAILRHSAGAAGHLRHDGHFGILQAFRAAALPADIQ